MLDGKCYNTRGRMQIPVFFAAKVEEEHRMLCSDLNNVFILEEHFAENPKLLLLNFEMIQTSLNRKIIKLKLSILVVGGPWAIFPTHNPWGGGEVLKMVLNDSSIYT